MSEQQQGCEVASLKFRKFLAATGVHATPQQAACNSYRHLIPANQSNCEVCDCPLTVKRSTQWAQQRGMTQSELRSYSSSRRGLAVGVLVYELTYSTCRRDPAVGVTHRVLKLIWSRYCPGHAMLDSSCSLCVAAQWARHACAVAGSGADCTPWVLVHTRGHEVR